MKVFFPFKVANYNWTVTRKEKKSMFCYFFLYILTAMLCTILRTLPDWSVRVTRCRIVDQKELKITFTAWPETINRFQKLSWGTGNPFLRSSCLGYSCSVYNRAGRWRWSSEILKGTRKVPDSFCRRGCLPTPKRYHSKMTSSCSHILCGITLIVVIILELNTLSRRLWYQATNGTKITPATFIWQSSPG